MTEVANSAWQQRSNGRPGTPAAKLSSSARPSFNGYTAVDELPERLLCRRLPDLDFRRSCGFTSFENVLYSAVGNCRGQSMSVDLEIFRPNLISAGL